MCAKVPGEWWQSEHELEVTRPVLKAFAADQAGPPMRLWRAAPCIWSSALEAVAAWTEFQTIGFRGLQLSGNAAARADEFYVHEAACIANCAMVGGATWKKSISSPV